MAKVITYQTPSGDTIDLTHDQIEKLNDAGVWPRNHRGEEYCSVSHGAHNGKPSLTDNEIREFIRVKTQPERQREANRIDGYNRDDLGESPDY